MVDVDKVLDFVQRGVKLRCSLCSRVSRWAGKTRVDLSEACTCALENVVEGGRQTWFICIIILNIDIIVFNF